MSGAETEEPGPRRMELAAGVGAIVLAVAVIVVVPPLRHCVSLAGQGEFGALR
ncbi:MAG TPA: hypothetical protein VG325_19890 [Solirubrobacteraceae bacterium]|nr:hypothetical protein [Solirubrobacteraceae bacterium]